MQLVEFLGIIWCSHVFLAFVVSLLVGLISGADPAYRASELDPIEALRSE